MPHEFPSIENIASKRGLSLTAASSLRRTSLRNQGIIEGGGAQQAGVGLVGITALALLAKPLTQLLARGGAGALRGLGILGSGTGAAVSRIPGGAGVGGALSRNPITTGLGVVGAGGVGLGALALSGGGGGGDLSVIGGGQNVAYSWNTGTATFYRLIDGRIAVQKRNGVWKVYWPARHIVVPRNPRIGTLLRADRRIDRMMKGIHKRAGGHGRRAPARTGATQRVQLIKQ